MSNECRPETLLDRPKVVIIDDDPDFRFLIGSFLGLQGYEVIIEAATRIDAEEAIPQIQALRTSGQNIKIILDGNLGAARGCRDGIELAGMIREAVPGVGIIECNNQGGISDPPLYGDRRIFKCDPNFLANLPRTLVA